MVHFLKNIFIWQNQELATLFRFLSISFVCAHMLLLASFELIYRINLSIF